jgi:ribonucleoside-diphosphate reductase alpha chain
VWLNLQRYFCEHKPSCTVYVKPAEWLAVGAWVYDHFDEVSGISFLPTSDHVYEQAPWQDIDADKYKELEALMPKSIDWDEGLSKFEFEDLTNGSQELACTGNSCELIDITK